MVLLAFALMVVFSAWFWHRFWPRLWLASLAASMSACLLFQIAAWVQQEFLDPFFMIGFVLSWLPAMLISLAVGWLMRKARAA